MVRRIRIYGSEWKAYFAEYEKAELKLQKLDVELADEAAIATSTYKSEYEEIKGESQPVTASGMITFELTKASGYWKINRIDAR